MHTLQGGHVIGQSLMAADHPWSSHTWIAQVNCARVLPVLDAVLKVSAEYEKKVIPALSAAARVDPLPLRL
jgi:hypothetical protein